MILRGGGSITGVHFGIQGTEVDKLEIFPILGNINSKYVVLVLLSSTPELDPARKHT